MIKVYFSLMEYTSLILPAYLDVGRGVSTVVYWIIKVAELAEFGLALSTSDTILEMCLLKKEIYFSDCPYRDIKTEFKETNGMCWYFLICSCVFVILHL